MKKFFLTMIFAFSILLSAQICFAQNSQKPCNFTDPPTKENKTPKVFRSVNKFFKKLFGDRKEIANFALNVECVEFDKYEVFTACDTENANCAADSQKISIKTEARSRGFLEVDAIYIYQVSAGKIIGKGQSVVWDLSGLSVGTYTIVIGADDGCGVCGKTVTREVKVIECPNCRESDK